MIILASASPRRRDILAELGVDFKIVTAPTDESSLITDPRALTEELAARKGRAVYEKLCAQAQQREAVVISADTVVACGGEILGKPRDREDAVRMLNALSGHTHHVVSGVAVTIDGITKSASCTTSVTVRQIPSSKLLEYAYSEEPMDKAGAYAIQGRFSVWIDSIEGSYFNVVGLPVSTLNTLYFDCTGKYLV